MEEVLVERWVIVGRGGATTRVARAFLDRNRTNGSYLYVLRHTFRNVAEIITSGLSLDSGLCMRFPIRRKTIK